MSKYKPLYKAGDYLKHKEYSNSKCKVIELDELTEVYKVVFLGDSGIGKVSFEAIEQFFYLETSSFEAYYNRLVLKNEQV